ncbi:Enterobactin exporter EntS [Andreprevotia sp. IGB-42]|uniref:MFS transporter n=1 Tax=Andreprevotia sp. IGB-42 TaxID=2497473 RepID=UPI001357A5CD|nr:MFS transporter [Andreprevotia sp. IGB-42]KAF0815120.1 Enterobactin exporter EntS [Andreprevotia sp. IGB-42]
MSSPSSPAAANGFAVLRNRNFAAYLSARLLSTIAMQMVNLAVGWQVYALTHSVTDLGLIGLAQFAPFFVLVLPAGQIADRYDRRVIINVAFAVQGIAALLLLAFTISGVTAVWPVFAAAALAGCARAFMMPASQAIVMNLVPNHLFGQATAISSSSFHAAVIAGPVLGGVLYLLGPHVVYTVATGVLALSVVLMWLVRSQQTAKREPVSLAGVLDGFRFIWSRKIVLGAISLDLFAVLFGGAVALLPVFAHDVLHVGPTGLGILRSAPAVGAALTSVALAFWPIRRHVGRWMFGGVALFGAATIVFGLSTSVLLSVVALALTGVGDMVSVYIRHMLVQFETPDAIRGRVSAVNAVFIGASNELGEFESGTTAGWFGLIPAVVFGGAATLVVTGLWMRIFPVLSHMDRFPHENRSGDAPAATLEPAPPAGQQAPAVALVTK